MMTVAEAIQRVRVNNARIQRDPGGDWKVTLNEWDQRTAEKAAYYTDDLEDAVLTAGAMRQRATANH